MKTTDFSILKISSASALLGLMVLCYRKRRGTPQPEDLNRPTELVLTLSDHWLETGGTATSSHSLNNTANDSAANPIRDKFKSRPVNIGCGMDVNPVATYDNSLTSRLVGECNLDYRY